MSNVQSRLQTTTGSAEILPSSTMVRLSWVLAVGALAGPGTVASQVATTGTIQGRVVARDSLPVPNATVRAARVELGFGREAATDGAGAFRIGFLPPGDYRFSVRRIGYRPSVIERVTVAAGSVTHLTVVLEAAAQGLDSMVVAAPSITIDQEKTEFGTTIGARELRLLPTPNEARNLVGFTNGAPTRSGLGWGHRPGEQLSIRRRRREPPGGRW